MEIQEKPAFGFVQNRLPWMVGGTALLLYLVTLNSWARLDSLMPISTAGGWSLYVTVRAPLLQVLTLPLRVLPAGFQAPALNLLTALMAALTLVLLARSVALLPFDRTRDARLRERSEFSLLSLPSAWMPGVLACVLAGLELSFWEHATAFTGEMLDLLLFAYVIRCLLEFRLDRRPRWLTRMAFVYGLAVTNNYAMIAFFPGFLIAVAWVKSWEFLNPAFLLRMLGAGAAGLLLYLYLPVLNTLGGEHLGSFWDHLRAVLGAQAAGLRSAPRWVVLVLSLTSLVPLCLLSIRWSAESPGTSAAGATIVGLLVGLVQVALLALCVSVFFESPLSARALASQFGVVMLPFYYVAALNIGYFAGHFLLLSQPVKGRGWTQAPSLLERLGKAAPTLVLAAILAAGAVLTGRNRQSLAATNTAALGRIADQMIAALPPAGAYVLGDGTEDLLLIEARLRHTQGVSPHVFLYAGWLEFRQYQERLARRHPGRWSVPAELPAVTGPLSATVVMAKLANLALSNEVYYVNPSIGLNFEVMRQVPRGPIYRVETLAPEPTVPPGLKEGDLKAAQEFWESAAPDLEPLTARPGTSPALAFLRGFYSRALNVWGVTVQRHGNAAGASRWFDLAYRLNTNNVVALLNRAYNAELHPPAKPLEKPVGEIELPRESLDRIIRLYGPFDQPRWVLETGGAFARAGLYRQALIEFDRLSTLTPTNAMVRLWKENMEVMSRLRLGNPAGAEQQALALQQQFPGEEIAFEALTQVYLATGRLTNAIENVQRQLTLNATNVNALLNKAAFHIQLGQFAEAIPTLDKLLVLQPQNQAALLNRAIAQLQDNRLTRAEQDYLALLKLAPEVPAVHFGLAEIDYRLTNHVGALAHYEQYLKYGPKGTEEYQSVEKRVKELRRTAKAP